MSLLRFSGRALFSSYFIADGYQMVAKPDKKVDQVRGSIEFCVPHLQSVLPVEIADRLPTDVRTWTRILGAAQIVGGLAYATGIARRPCAALLAVTSVPQVVNAATSDDRSELFAKIALLGGALVAVQDTAGRPGIAWKAEQSRKSIEQRVDAAEKDADRLTKKAQAKVKQAEAQAKRVGNQVQAQVKDAVR